LDDVNHGETLQDYEVSYCFWIKVKNQISNSKLENINYYLL